MSGYTESEPRSIRSNGAMPISGSRSW
jgi:hypothetical protein